MRTRQPVDDEAISVLSRLCRLVEEASQGSATAAEALVSEVLGLEEPDAYTPLFATTWPLRMVVAAIEEPEATLAFALGVLGTQARLDDDPLPEDGGRTLSALIAQRDEAVEGLVAWLDNVAAYDMPIPLQIRRRMRAAHLRVGILDHHGEDVLLARVDALLAVA